MATVTGTTGSEALEGTDGADVIAGGGGHDSLFGGGGMDTAVFSGARSLFDLVSLSGVTRVTGREGAPWQYVGQIARLTEVESVQFSDQTLSIAPAPGQLVLGSANSESMQGGAGIDVFDGWGGHDSISGGGGNDIALFFGLRSDFDVLVLGPGAWEVTGKESAEWRYVGQTVRLHSVEELQFADSSEVTETPEPPPAIPLEGAELIATMAMFAKAAYTLRPDEPLTDLAFFDDYLNDPAPGAQEALDALKAAGWHMLDADDLGAELSLPHTQADGEFHAGLASGIYTNGNGGLLLARSADALVIAVRGTNDARFAPSVVWSTLWGWLGAESPDQSNWIDQDEHSALFLDAITAVEAYLQSHPEIRTVHVTGHSLGASVAQELVLDEIDVPQGVTVGATLFASPGWPGGLGQSDAISNFWVDGDPIESSAAIFSNAGDKNTIEPVIQWRDGQQVQDAAFSAGYLASRGVDSTGGDGVERHAMSLYLHIAQRMAGSLGDAADRFLSGAGAEEFDRVVLQIDANLNLEAGAPERDDDEWHWYEFTEPASSSLDGVTLGITEHAVYIGTAGADSLSGTGASDLFVAGAGNDTINGRGGVDTALYDVPREQATITVVGSVATVQVPGGGSDSLTNVERLQFDDQRVALDLSGSAGDVAKVIGAVFGPEYVGVTGIVGIGLGVADSGVDLAALAGLAISTGLFGSLAGGADGLVSDEEFVGFLYENVMGVLPGNDELSYLAGLIAGGTHTRQSLATLASDLAQNLARIDFVGLVAQGLAFTD